MDPSIQKYSIFRLRLMFGMMLPTWFLSMWISNTATTAMMIPIANAVLVQLKETKDRENAEFGEDIGL